MENIIQELVQDQTLNVWIKHPCPFCEGKKLRSILSTNVTMDGIVYHCFSHSCIAHGYHRISFTPSIEQVLATLDTQEDGYKRREYDLPWDVSTYIPQKFFKWLSGYYIDGGHIREHNILYSHKHTYKDKEIFTDRLIIPTPSGFVARSLSDEPKWLNFTDYDYILSPNKGHSVVLVEDPISCIRVSEFMPCMCLFGTTLKDVQVDTVLKYKNVIVFLDGDKAGWDGISNVINKVGFYTNVRSIITNKDPKEFDPYTLKEILYGH